MQISNEDYEQLKPLLFSLGYRLLGSVTDAEDLVQETFLRAYQAEEREINNKKAYLCKMMTNRCLDVLKSARRKREQYVGPWLPEPLLITSDDPSEAILQKEGLSMAYLRMMEHLTPHERAVFLLREVFTFSYREIASMMEKKEDNCRKLYSRAKEKLSAVKGESLHYENNRSVVDRFIHSFQTEDQGDLLELLSDHVTLYTDGGGKVRAALRPIYTKDHVAAFLFGIAKKRPNDFYVEVKNVNGQPALISYADSELYNVICFYIVGGQIQDIYIIMNPEKLPSNG
ncbi:RNA polymerase sigma-70 factor [Halalkalibacterium halodurans]|uniref:RNA polymerase subunit sigma n=1 Tax=Halalkalibacterium halodurans TaxID=86665 RepID=A0A0M0KBN5_ALKHA|nr:RNA polymerase sigma-70 factor [Halalkalibacterium halodurans]MDY7221168.1 RNA polymerase sigma-70 factor [Halalkalibacterium halodurans]MDY7240407.1 RNA polymerase sigma-70 factor [Halalkalibacterium halodurans]TPE70018.1 RNA polymerase sigma-70 factor [Halalkalibacterium halodurans]